MAGYAFGWSTLDYRLRAHGLTARVAAPTIANRFTDRQVF